MWIKCIDNSGKIPKCSFALDSNSFYLLSADTMKALGYCLCSADGNHYLANAIRPDDCKKALFCHSGEKGGGRMKTRIIGGGMLLLLLVGAFILAYLLGGWLSVAIGGSIVALGVYIAVALILMAKG